MELYKKLNIDKKVFNYIISKLKRVPNDFETYLFSAMHSEHCGYLHSKKYLNDFYTENNFNNENAGCIKIKDYSVFFKMESHNHPCAIEPYQGAMTGIGGIIRDILSLGANPVCLLNSLKFGKIKENKTKYYLQEVVRGISTYGNSVGIPVISGETIFEKCFNNIPIVNVLALGLVKTNKIKLSCAKANAYIIILGSKTGVDGLPVPPHKLYNIGKGKPENLLDFVDILHQELVRAGVLPEDFDFSSHIVHVPMQPGDVPVTYADTEALARDFHYTPATDLRTGLRRFSEWYADYYKDKRD